MARPGSACLACRSALGEANQLRTAHRSASTYRRRAVLTAQAPDRTGQTQASRATPNVEAECSSDGYPQFEKGSPEEGLFPLRQPGSFPNATAQVQTNGEVEKVALGDTPSKEFDPLRDGPLRYLGYANECGEAFAAWLPPGGVPFSYAVAISYVLVDTVDKGQRAFKQAKTQLQGQDLPQEVSPNRLSQLLALERALDTVIWQLLASVAIPGYTIHTVVYLAHELLSQVEGYAQFQGAMDSLSPRLAMTAPALTALLDKSLPTMIGLAAIPFIVHPIDNLVHAILNVSLRPAMRKFLCGPAGGSLADLDMCSEECQPPNP